MFPVVRNSDTQVSDILKCLVVDYVSFDDDKGRMTNKGDIFLFLSKLIANKLFWYLVVLPYYFRYSYFQ